MVVSSQGSQSSRGSKSQGRLQALERYAEYTIDNAWGMSTVRYGRTNEESREIPLDIPETELTRFGGDLEEEGSKEVTFCSQVSEQGHTGEETSVGRKEMGGPSDVKKILDSMQPTRAPGCSGGWRVSPWKDRMP